MGLWTTKVVCHFISTRFGVEDCRERVRQGLHALGFRLRRRRHRHLKAKPEERGAGGLSGRTGGTADRMA